MNDWHDEIADSFPDRRDDEPESLREDIAAELTDHLACALNRELLLAPDEKTAIQKVLERFGDPRKIARKLWFDSMKEKLMGQRITLAASIFAAAASIAACAMVYVVANQSRAATLMFVEQGKILVEEARAHSKMQQDQLEEFRKNSKSIEFNNVKVRLVTDAPGNPPAVGCKVTLTDEKAGGSGVDAWIEDKSNNDGVVDFGLLRYGRYNLSIHTKDGETTRTRFGVAPGKAFEKTYVVPAARVGEADVSINVEWPEDLRKEKLLAHCRLTREPRRIEGTSWTPEGELGERGGYHVIVNSDGEILAVFQFDLASSNDVYVQAENEIKPESIRRSVTLPAGRYHLNFIVARRPLGEGYSKGSTNWGPEVRSEAVAHINFLERMGQHQQMRVNRTDPPSAGRGFANPSVVNLANEGYQFEAKQGEANRWTFVIPADAIQYIRNGFESLRIRDEMQKRAATDAKSSVPNDASFYVGRDGRREGQRDRQSRFSEMRKRSGAKRDESANRIPVEAIKPATPQPAP